MVRVNRVYCYSKEVAKQNGNRLPILMLVLLTIVFTVVLIVVADLTNSESLTLILLITFGFMGVLTYYSCILGLRLRTRMTGWATTEDNRIFKAMTVNNGQGLFLAGVAAGSIVDQLAKNGKDIAPKVGGTVGAAAEFYSISRSAKYMTHPEIVAKMVEEAPNITGAEVIEILKVYSITEKKHSFKVKCDYKMLRLDAVLYNKNITIEKSYNCLNDLINIINTHK